MKINWLLTIGLIVLFCISNISYSQIKDTSLKIQDNDRSVNENRATLIFRILNDAGINFENTRTKTFQFIKQDNYTEARNCCASFLREIQSVRNATKIITTLSKEDLQYVDNSLNRMQKQIEQLSSSLPFFN